MSTNNHIPAPYNSASSMLYAMADLIGTPLFLKDDLVRAVTVRSFPIDHLWHLTTHVTLVVDEATSTKATAFVHLRKKLWMYVIVTKDNVWTLMFDGDRANIRVGAEKEFGLGNSLQSLKKLQDSITACFAAEVKAVDQASKKPMTWTPFKKEELLQGL